MIVNLGVGINPMIDAEAGLILCYGSEGDRQLILEDGAKEMPPPGFFLPHSFRWGRGIQNMGYSKWMHVPVKLYWFFPSG